MRLSSIESKRLPFSQLLRFFDVFPVIKSQNFNRGFLEVIIRDQCRQEVHNAFYAFGSLTKLNQ